jgi:hypothetical protein
MATLDTHVTSRADDDTVMDGLRRVFPFRWVVLPWLVARLLVVPVLISDTYGPGVRIRPGGLIAMDGGWFRIIAQGWYDHHEGTAVYPFFPLFPTSAGALMKLGVPATVALAGLAWIAALLAMAGVRLLAQAHVGAGAARLAPWVIALAPGGISLILGYSDAFYLAAIVWALLALDRRHWWAAGLLAAVATASRPNGMIAVVIVVAVAIGMRATRRQLFALALPSLAFLAGWMIYLQVSTGDALLFWTAKSQWDELSAVQFITHPLHQRLPLFHVLMLAVFVVPYMMRIGRQPRTWLLVVILGVLPSVALGVVGVARYAILAFPLPIAFADLLSEQRRSVQVACLTLSALVLVAFARLVVVYSWVP